MHSYQPNINFQLNKRTTPVHGSNIFMYVNACSGQIHPIKDPIRDSGGATYSRDIGGDRTPVFCDHPVLYYYLE